MLLIPVRIDFSLFQNINRHHKQTNQMHCVFVQMIVVFFPVPFSDFIVIPYNVVHLIPDILIIAQGIM